MRRIDPYLLVLLLLAAVARFWGLGFGLPYIDARPDETTIITVARGFFSGDFNPHFFNYPTFYMYCAFVLHYAAYLYGLLSGKYHSPADFVLRYTLDPAGFVLLDRAFSALLGTLTVFVVYKVARGLFDRRTALVASFFLALAHLHVRDSHFGVTDIAATFLIMCAVFFLQKAYADKKLRSCVYAGLFAGLAASTKYAGALLAAPMFFLYGLNLWQGKGSGARRLLDWRILAFLAALAAAFLLGTPFALLDYARFHADLQFEMEHLLHGHQILLQKGWLYHLRFSLFFGLGWSLLLGLLPAAARSAGALHRRTGIPFASASTPATTATATWSAARPTALATAASTRHRRGRGLLFLAGRLAEHATVDPHLATDGAVGREARRKAVVHVRLQRVQRDGAQDHALSAAHLGAAEAPRHLDLDAARAGLHAGLGSLLHRASEAGPALELLGYVLGAQLCVQVGVLDLDDVDRDAAVGELFQRALELVDLGALGADHQARARGLEDDLDFLASPLDLDGADGGVRGLAVEFLVDEAADPLVLDQELAVVALGSEPAALPADCHARAKSNWVNFLTHSSLYSMVSTTTVMWLVRLRMECARPRSLG